MTRGRGAARGHGIFRWVLPASVLHVAGVLLVAALSPWARPRPERATPRPASMEREASVQLTLLEDDQWSMDPGAVSSGANPFEAAPPPVSDEPVPRVDLSRLHGTRADLEPSARRAAASLALTHAASPALSGRDQAPASPPSNEAAHPAPPRLSLEQLGLGANPFMELRVEPLTQAEQANSRLQAALRTPFLERDRRHGMGPAGPVADAARRLVLADDGLVESSAVLNVRVDGAGHVTDVHVLESSSQSRAWQWIAARLAQALDPATLRTAGSKRGWDMKLRLASSVRLPSGAAPGMRMGVLGQRLAGSGGPGSTSLELSPTSKLDLKEPIDSIGRHLDQPIRFEVMLLKFRADPSDMGALARRVVELAVLSIDEIAAP